MRTLSMRAAVAALAVLAGGSASAQAPAAFQLSSSDIRNAAFAPVQIANTFGCSGGNVSPALTWSAAPAGTQSFVLTMYDPDAPTGSGFWHWIVANIPATATGIPGGASKSAKMPAGSLETRTDYGTPGYGGPCPPAGDAPHRYVFTLFALKVPKIDVTADTSGAVVGFMTRQNSIATATFTARHGR